jgi:hypothetical protein
MNEAPLSSSRPRLPTVDAAILLVLAAVLIAALAIVTSHAHSGDDTATVPAGGSSIVTTRTTSVDTGASSASQEASQDQTQAPDVLTDSELQALLKRYVTAYADEDTIALARLMSAGIVRESVGQPTSVGITAVLGEYVRQFRANGTTGYKLDAPDVTRTDGEATLATRYTITTTNAPASTGVITMHVVRRSDGDLAIDRISVRAD